jgi:hypothetical protein
MELLAALDVDTATVVRDVPAVPVVVGGALAGADAPVSFVQG